MTFLHPWAIFFGVLVAGVPLVVHLLTKPRPVILPLSTLRFLQEVIHERRARNVLRDVLILILRTLAILLIALAISRPQWGTRPLISDQVDGDTVRVVALDVSQSMAATDHGVAIMERARTCAANYLRFHPGLKVNLLLVGAETRGIFESPSVNFDHLRGELAKVEVLPQRVHVQKLVEVAGKMLTPVSEDDHRRRELVIISDFQRSGWAKTDMSSLPEGTQIQWESVAPPESLPNLAVLDVRTHTEGLIGGPSQCEIDLFNGSPHVRQVEVELQIGESLWNLKVTCPPESTTTLTQEIQWKQTGWLAGEARLVDVDDALTADNTRSFVVHVPLEPNYLIITRQATTLQPSSSYFLECALSLLTATSGKSPNVQRVDPSEVDSASLVSIDLVVIDHPGKLPENTIKQLTNFFRRGKPVLYVASEMQDAANLKLLLEASEGSVQLPVEFIPPAAGRPRRDLTLTYVKQDRPPFHVFGDHLNNTLESLHFSGGLESRRLAGQHDDDLLAMYNDGSACLVLSTSDVGALAVINADLSTSNLPKTGAFVPLMEELVNSLIYRNRKKETVYCGEPVFVQLPGDAGPASRLKPVNLKHGISSWNSSDKSAMSSDQEKNYGNFIDEETNTVWHWNTPDNPGAYEVMRGGDVVFAQAVAIPSEESHLETLDMKNLASRLSGAHVTFYRSVVDGGERSDDLWVWLAVGCVLCMIGEVSIMLLLRD